MTETTEIHIVKSWNILKIRNRFDYSCKFYKCDNQHKQRKYLTTLWADKNTPKCFFWYTVYETWPIVTKFGTYCPE